MNKYFRSARAIMILVALEMLTCVIPAQAAPPIPYTVWGAVTIGIDPAPVGSVITAWIAGVQYASFTVTIKGWYGLMNIPGDDPDTPGIKEGGVPGETVNFQVNGWPASPTGAWQSGGPFRLNLTGQVPTAVELASYSLTPARGGVKIAWETACEVGNAGFQIYRGETVDVASASKINKALIPSQAVTSMVGTSYSYTDKSAKPWKMYHYWLEDVPRETTISGSMHYLGQAQWCKPGALRVHPAAGGRPSGQPQTFTATYRDLDADLAIMYLLVNDTLRWEGGLLVRYDAQRNAMSLYDDQSGRWLPEATPGTGAGMSNLHGGLFTRVSSANCWRQGTVWTVNWTLRFWESFRGEHNVYIKAVDAAGNQSNWVRAGSWTVQ